MVRTGGRPISAIDLDPTAVPAATSVWPDERSQRTTLVTWGLAALVGVAAVLVGMALLFGPAAIAIRVAGTALAARGGTCLVLWAASPTARDRMAQLT